MDVFCPNGHAVPVPAQDLGTELRCPVCDTRFVARASAGINQGRDVPGRAAPSARARWQWSWALLDQMRPMTQAFLLLGLVLALFTRGWDGVSDRYVLGARSHVQNAITQWNDRWEDRLDRISQEEKSLRLKENLTAADRERLDQLRTEYQKLQNEREADRQQQVERWNDLERSAREAETQNQMVKPWREGFFVLGTILLAVGLLAAGYTAEGPVRWFCLGLLAIIVFSIYFGADNGLKPGRPSPTTSFPRAT